IETRPRFYGDTLYKRAGGLRMIRFGAFLACLGLGLVLVPWLPVVLLGFCLMGLGYSSVVPVLMTYAGNVPNMSPALGIASVASAGYIGFLGGPVLIGFLAGQFGLSMGYAVFSLMLTATAFLMAPRALSWAQ
ncbi:MAG: MFS transporter, partial [Bacteroidota bacterium]